MELYSKEKETIDNFSPADTALTLNELNAISDKGYLPRMSGGSGEVETCEVEINGEGGIFARYVRYISEISEDDPWTGYDVASSELSAIATLHVTVPKNSYISFSGGKITSSDGDCYAEEGWFYAFVYGDATISVESNMVVM